MSLTGAFLASCGEGERMADVSSGSSIMVVGGASGREMSPSSVCSGLARIYVYE